MSPKVSKCSLCTDGKLWDNRKEYINHLNTFHRILRAKDFAEVVESLPENQIEEKETNVECLKLDPEGQHWRCIRFKCRECDFSTHVSSNLKLHQIKKNHFGSFKTEQMRVILRSARYKFGTGDLVLAKMGGYPFWPGIIDMTPDPESISDFMIKRHYRVRFFEKNRTSFGLISEENITKYKKTELPPMPKKPQAVSLKAAFSWADYVLDWSPDERMSYFQNQGDQIRPEPSTVDQEGEVVEDEEEALDNATYDPAKQQEIENIFGCAGLKYEVGDLVLGKMDGYPFWPGIIHRVPEKTNIYDFVVQRQYTVRFFEEKTTSFGNVPEKKIKKFEQNMLETASKKPKQLAEAYIWAEYVLDWPPEERTVYFKGQNMDI